MTLVVIGGGLAGGTAVTELRSAGYQGQIVLYGAEHHLPYERPPLSKGYLLGNDPLDVAFVHGPDWYDDNDIDLRLGVPVTGIDRARRVVVSADGEQPYDKLLLATGAIPRRLALADESGAPVAYLRTIEDSNRLKESFGEGLRVTIIGGGWIGLEVAAAARIAGSDVTVVESLSLPLLRVLGPEVATVFADLHKEHGVDLLLGSEVTAIDPDGKVRLAGGRVIESDLLVVGIGAAPDVSLGEAAGLETDNGILVDEQLRSSDADVYAAGDVANHQHPALGRRVRVEHWDTAIEQAKVAARNLLGAGKDYDRLPYFFTDQYDFGMEYVGSVGPGGYDTVVLRGDVKARIFTAFWVKNDQVVAGMHANDWDAIDPIRAIVGRSVDLAKLNDESVALADL